MPKIIKLVKKNDSKNLISQGLRTPVPQSSSLPIFQDSNILSSNFLLTCQSGLESLVKRECERIGVQDIHAQDRLVKCGGSLENLYELLIQSRFANRVYLDLTPPSLRGDGGSFRVNDFDMLHESLRKIQWNQYLTGRERIVIEASSTRSALSSIPTIQSVGQNAIFSTLVTPNYTSDTEVHILILIIDDIAHILLDVTGDPLHKRGYRRDAGEAPLKENLGAALVALANWKYRTPLLDPFCGSGTILIEAAMIARNIAPGLFRSFRIEELPFHDADLLEKVRKRAEEKIYPSGSYTLIGQDIDPEMIRISEENARRAGVVGDIRFSVGDYLEDSKGFIQNSKGTHADSESGIINPESGICIVTNPPYGQRLQSNDLDAIYQKLIREVTEYGGGFITTYPVDIRFGLANRKLLNGGEECRFWYKKN